MVKTKIDLDAVGTTASLTCAIHCAIMPLMITLLPLVGLSFLSSNKMEWGLLAVSAAIGSVSLCLGYRQHRRGKALGILGSGLFLVVLGRIAEEHSALLLGLPLVVLGGTTVAGSHWLNRRLCETCSVCADHETESH